jgi:hypothetical protein
MPKSLRASPWWSPVRSGSKTEVSSRARHVCSTPQERTSSDRPRMSVWQPNSDMTLIRRPQKKKPPRRRLFNTGRCGVGQRLSHVYSRPTQPLQDSQRDCRNERPDHITEFVAKTAAITRTSSVTITAYQCTRRARFIREHPTCPSTSSRGICEATLGRSPNARRPQPTMQSCHIPARGEDEDGRRTTRPDAIASPRSRSR